MTPVDSTAPAELYGAEAAERAAGRLERRFGSSRPHVGIVLGSGLGGLSDRITDPVRVPFREIPGFPATSVEGHAGMLVAGELAGKRVVALAGRFHLYEGHTPQLAAFPVRVMHALGARTLLVSNAAGAVRADLKRGDLMLIADHINLMWRNPLIGPPPSTDDSSPDVSPAYDPELRRKVSEAAGQVRLELKEGVYGALTGPQYETPAEVRMLGRMGVDAVGMSTVPEVLVARALGMRVVGISCITNLACGLSPVPLTHEEVLETTRRVGGSFEELVIAWLAQL